MPVQWLNSAGTGRNGVPPPVSSVPPPEIALPPPKFVVPPPGNDVPSPFGEKSLKLLPPCRGQIKRLKCTKYYFGWGSAPDRWGDYSARPERIAGRGLGRKGGKGERIEEGKEMEGIGRNVAFHHLLLSNLTTGYGRAHMPFPSGSLLERSLSPAVSEILRSKRIGVT